MKVTRGNTHCYYTFDKEGLFGPLKERLIYAYYESLRDAEPFNMDRDRLKKLKDECDADCEIGEDGSEKKRGKMK